MYIIPWTSLCVLGLSIGHGLAQCTSCVDPHAVPSSGYTVKTYHESDEHVENPHRGIINLYDTHASSHSPLSKSSLDHRRQNSGETMIMRSFILDTFRTSPISDDYMSKIRHDLDVIDSASFTVVLRFYYISDTDASDASKDVVLQHVEQLRPIFHEYERIITAVQAGFIGAWGEWHSSTHFGVPEWDTPGHDPVSGLMPSAYRDRLDLLHALLQNTPKSIQIQVRTPEQKMHMISSTPATWHDVERGDEEGRIGHHNDCFLASDSDSGTYHNKATEYPYLAEDTRYVIMGGETCAVTNNHRHECPTALKELAMFHWTFLNQGWNPAVYNVWKHQGCFEEVHRRLGYRLVLKKAILPDTVRTNDNLCFHLEFTNTGFAAPAKVFDVFFILQSSSGSHYYAAKIHNVDVRTWLPGHTYTVNAALHVDSVIHQGQYKVLVALSDRLLGDRADYNVLLANSGVPLYTKGLNDLHHTISVTGYHSSSVDCPSLSAWQPPSAGHNSRVFKGSFR